ncbi:hypothetical protein SCHPADRAFT_302337 [Schizopora paradoxa]|uniref:FYVE-type domain-containing protein n=1 Tax=Schizopora paradoxa TaxID=27342 RepID=A0A0H2RYU8_9AGAM|nr:hypothetical protein SCHPADRAFT_302337 [Schizopora paradoxa]
MSASSTPYVPYQAYKSKRHSRISSTPLLEPNVEPPQPSSTPRHSFSNSFDATNRRSDALSNGNGDPRTTISASTSPEPTFNGPLFLRTGGALNGRRISAIGIEAGNDGPRLNGNEIRSVQSEPTSPGAMTAPVGLSLVTTNPNGTSNPEPNDVSQENSPGGSDSGKSSSSPPSQAGTSASSDTAGQSSRTVEAGSSTDDKPASTPRKSSFRYVPLRAPSGSTAPKTSSPLRPQGSQSRTVSVNNALSNATTSPARPSPRAFDNSLPQLPPPEPEIRSPPTPLSPPAPPTQTALSPTPVIPIHARSSSLMALSPPPRTSSLILQPPLAAPSTGQSPSPPRPPSPRSNISSPRMQSPVPSGASASSSRAVYRPGFQPKGVYRPLTDDFLSIRKEKREVGRVERTRLERRLEKLVDLHFPREGEANGKGKEKSSAPPMVSRRSSSIFDIDFNELRSKTASDIWRGVLESRAAAANGGKGDVRAAEQVITPWQDDSEASACPLCSASFHPLTNRKHHCRLCGRIICSLPVKRPQRPLPCSLLFIANSKTGRLEEVSEGVDYGVRPRSRMDSINGKNKGAPAEETFLKGVRICRDCKPTMLCQQYRQDAQRTPLMVRLYNAMIGVEGEIEEALPPFHELILKATDSADENQAKEAAAIRKHLVELFADYDALAKRLRKLPCPEGPGSSQDRVQAAITTRATLFLQKNLIPLQSIPLPKKSKAGADPSTPSDINDAMDSQIIDPDSELAQTLQPLLEQEALLESFIEEAKQHRKFEDAKTLKANLGEIRAEIDRIVIAADSRPPPPKPTGKR